MAPESSLWKPSISEIRPGLFIGNEHSTWNEQTLAENHITAVVSLSYVRLGLWHQAKFTRHVPAECHLHIGCKDSSTQDLLKHLDTICNFIDRMSIQGSEDEDKRVLVHCSHGISRSPAAAIAYLMRKHRESLASVLDQVRAKRPVTKLNPNFMVQLEIWGNLEYEIWEDSAKTIPKQAYADWLDQRLILCKAKGLTGNEPDIAQDLSDL